MSEPTGCGFRVSSKLCAAPGWQQARDVGQRQRVAAARALLGDPPLVIADEPTSALDEGNQQRFMDLLHAARRASGAALLFVTHDPRLVQDFDRLIDLSDQGAWLR